MDKLLAELTRLREKAARGLAGLEEAVEEPKDEGGEEDDIDMDIDGLRLTSSHDEPVSREEAMDDLDLAPYSHGFDRDMMEDGSIVGTAPAEDVF